MENQEEIESQPTLKLSTSLNEFSLKLFKKLSKEKSKS